MPVLSADITATQTYLPDPLDPGFYTIGSENIRVTSDKAYERDPDRQHGELRTLGPVILRGIGSTAAAHSAGATITAYSTAAPDTGGAGGGFANPATEPLDMDGFEVQNAPNLATLLADPGNVWEAETAVVEGYRIVFDGFVLEATGDGTTGIGQPTFDVAGIGSETADGDLTWLVVGIVGNVAPAAVSDLVQMVASGQAASVVESALGGQTVPLTTPTVQDVIDALIAAFGLVQSD